jgi:hypothetical protein
MLYGFSLMMSECFPGDPPANILRVGVIVTKAFIEHSN